MVKDKKEHIEKLQLSDLIELSLKLLPKIGISSISRVTENTIEGDVVVPNVGTFKNSYLHFTDKLSRDYHDIENLVTLINKKNTNGIDKVVIISSKSISNNFEVFLEQKVSRKKSVEYWSVDVLLKKIEEHYSDYWRHDDQELIAFEASFEKAVTESSEIKKLIEYKAAYQKLLQIFIEPTLFLRTEDKQSTKKAFTKISIDKAIEENKKVIMLHGEAGVGKTRLLNEIGKRLIDKNTKITGKRLLPIFIDSIILRDGFDKDGNIDFPNLIYEIKLKEFFPKRNIEFIFDNYQMVLLIDSIDEFDDDHKDKILQQLEQLFKRSVNAFIGSRSTSIDEMFSPSSGIDARDVFIQKFSNDQVEKFTARYFEGKGNRGQALIESMKENKILEKLPLTPLNLSLISILYEETNQEVPATISDIYDKFMNLLLGRTMVDKSIDFLNITVKENILCTYALNLLQSKNAKLKTKEEFFEFFNEKFSSVSGTVDLKMLPQALDFIIQHTGLLVLHKNKYVKFRHDSYMEYFAAKEIFINHREFESELVDKFFDVNWQYAAIFYGGMSKRMPDFLESIIKKVRNSKNMQEYWASVNGMGYLLQALYMTDDSIRKRGVLETLKIMIDTYEWLKKVASTHLQPLSLGKISLPILSIFPIFIFMDNFDSMTLRQPLSLALEELLGEYEKRKTQAEYPYLENIVYQIMMLTVTMSSDRINMGEDKILEVVEKLSIKNDEFYSLILEAVIENLDSSNLRKQKDEILRPRKTFVKQGAYYQKSQMDHYLQPASRERFSRYDLITPNRRVKLLVEGKSDAIILEHAYFVLTGNTPYWEIKVGNPNEGGAKDLADALNHGLSYLEDDQIVIGIFDNDSKGIQEFMGSLKPAKFDLVNSYDRIKKCKTHNIYGMLSPIPHEMQHYIQEKQQDNYFSIEHYFPKDFLESHKMLNKTAIDNIFQINDKSGAKMEFAREIQKLKQLELFTGFIPLFKEIDRIAGMKDEVIYNEKSL